MGDQNLAGHRALRIAPDGRAAVWAGVAHCKSVRSSPRFAQRWARSLVEAYMQRTRRGVRQGQHRARRCSSPAPADSPQVMPVNLCAPSSGGGGQGRNRAKRRRTAGTGLVGRGTRLRRRSPQFGRAADLGTGTHRIGGRSTGASVAAGAATRLPECSPLRTRPGGAHRPELPDACESARPQPMIFACRETGKR